MLTVLVLARAAKAPEVVIDASTPTGAVLRAIFTVNPKAPGFLKPSHRLTV